MVYGIGFTTFISNSIRQCAQEEKYGPIQFKGMKDMKCIRNRQNVVVGKVLKFFGDLWGSLGFLCKLAQHLLIWVYISEIGVKKTVPHLMVIKKEGKQ